MLVGLFGFMLCSSGRREDVSGVLAAPVLPTMNLVPVIPTAVDIHNRHLGRVGEGGDRSPKGEDGKHKGQGVLPCG